MLKIFKKRSGELFRYDKTNIKNHNPKKSGNNRAGIGSLQTLFGRIKRVQKLRFVSREFICDDFDELFGLFRKHR